VKTLGVFLRTKGQKFGNNNPLFVSMPNKKIGTKHEKCENAFNAFSH
jgi:hypothetical protein